MFHQLVNHNDDLRRLRDRGYAIAFDEGHLIVRDIPYLDVASNLQWGAFATPLEFIDQTRVKQKDHQVFFAGGVPHGLDKCPIPRLASERTASLRLSPASQDVVVQRQLSNKPYRNGQWGTFADFFEKIESYTALISGPAIELHGANPFTFRSVETISSDSPFKFQDTLTSRAEIGDLSAKLKDDVIAVIGLGGTGSYLLDFLVKMPVREIRAYDLDDFHVHNSFRSPGRLQESELGRSKAEVYRDRYDNFRTGLSITAKFIDAGCLDDLRGATFAFVCVDKGSSRAAIFEALISLGIPFIDLGMGLRRKGEALSGMMRITYFSVENARKQMGLGLVELEDTPDDLYRNNIQISELNALNASLAIMRFKQLRGFYFEEAPYYDLAFEIGDLKTIGEWDIDAV